MSTDTPSVETLPVEVPLAPIPAPEASPTLDPVERFKEAMKPVPPPEPTREEPLVDREPCDSWPEVSGRRMMGQSIAFMFPFVGHTEIFIQGSFYDAGPERVDLEGLYGRTAYTSLADLITKGRLSDDRIKLLRDKVAGFWQQAHPNIRIRKEV